jgi:hypothetical protein
MRTLGNYAIAEVAMMRDRPESQVEADIEAARRLIRERLLAGGHLQEAGELAAASSTAPGMAGDLLQGSHEQ